ncbi:MAG: rhodanese-like domain-containing protein [Dongiaceae bacterium]
MASRYVPALLALLAVAATALPATAQSRFGFGPGEAGQGRVCYFGECAQQSGSYSGSPPAPGTAPAPVYGTYAEELEDFGIAPQSSLKPKVGAPTPLTIPGGTTVTTAAVVEALDKGVQFLLIDALKTAGHPSIPNAYDFGYAGHGGTFDDDVQERLWRELSQLTGHRPDIPLVFFCQGARCWESYNAALRAIQMGFSNVYWYRGGLAAWQAAGLPLAAPGN